MEPCPKRRLSAEAAQAAIRAEKDVLREIARVLVVANEPIAQLMHRTAMPFDNEIECACTAGEARFDDPLSSSSDMDLVYILTFAFLLRIVGRCFH